MDINSLLSPQDPPASNGSSAFSSSSTTSASTSHAPLHPIHTTPARSRKRSSLLVQPATLPPGHLGDSQQQHPPSSRQASLLQPSFAQQASHPQAKHASILPQPAFPPVAYPPIAPQPHPQLPPLARSAHSHIVPIESRHAQSSQSAPYPIVQRHSSSSMDTLADLATMQHYQHTIRQNSATARKSELLSPQRSPSRIKAPKISPPLEHHIPTTAGPLRRASIVNDLSEPPAPIVSPRAFVSSSMSSGDLQTISDLTKQLAENSYLYSSHVQLITLLHQGFRAHLSPCAGEDAYNDPHTYPLLSELRQARQAMDTRFACGEDLLLTWIKDEIVLSKSIEDRIGVMELCRKAVEDEPGSPALWRLYGDWMWYLHKTSKDLTIPYENSSIDADTLMNGMLATYKWTEGDKALGSEVFTWDQTVSVWQEAVSATQWHIAESHTVWDSYMQLLLLQLETSSNPENVVRVRHLFSERLRTPHLTWDDTFSVFSQFVSKYDKSSYESTMAFETAKASRAKEELALREQFELMLQQAIDKQDRDAEWNSMTEYLDWEYAQHRRKNSPVFSLNLLVALSERCSLRFPTDAGFWEDHVDLYGERSNANEAVIAVVTRATRHAPWVGNLWAKYLYALEAANSPFKVVERVKHEATSTGLLEEVDMSELIKVYSAWCGYLRRRAFDPKSGEDERDVAEVAIRSAIENVKETGQKRFGKDFKGDPAFRIERIYFKFLGQTEHFDEARRYWQQLSVTHGDQYDFWERWYLWEMVVWSKMGASDRPEQATAVLLKAIRRPSLDWPERMIDQYLHHCCQNESVEHVQEAYIEVRKRSREIAKRRAREAAEANTQHVTAESSARANGTYEDSTMTEDHDEQTTSSKRKRAHEDDGPESSKRSRAEDNLQGVDATDSSSKQAQVKRDRENTSIVAKNLPSGTGEMGIRKFFKDCGEILSVVMSSQENDILMATVEFETHDDVLSAQTKNMKSINGHVIEVQAGTGTTLWVTNYPPEADEAYLRDLFSPLGEVVSIRFPSLKVNSHRRFCYVQFATADQAQAATRLDGKALGGPFVLSAKISDPIAKKNRSGAIEEGRECYVGNVDWNTTEKEVRQLFEEYGKVEAVRIPRNMSGKSKGAAFVVFASKEEADKAASALDKREFRSRILKVEVSKAIHAKKRATTVIRSTTTSGSPDAEALPDADQVSAKGTGADHKERSLALLNIPDTINDARIRALCEPYGVIKKIVLRLENSGALIEFESTGDVGRAGMALDGREIIPGHRIRVGEAREVFKSAARSEPTTNQAKVAFLAPPVSRPTAGGGRAGRRGGLGFKRAGADGKTNGAKAEGSKDEKGGKSQDDFRALLNQA